VKAFIVKFYDRVSLRVGHIVRRPERQNRKVYVNGDISSSRIAKRQRRINKMSP